VLIPTVWGTHNQVRHFVSPADGESTDYELRAYVFSNGRLSPAVGRLTITLYAKNGIDPYVFSNADNIDNIPLTIASESTDEIDVYVKSTQVMNPQLRELTLID